MNTVV
jgi:hypothetical protein